MRATSCVAAVLLGLGLAGSARAQAWTFGNNSQQLQFQVVSTDPNQPIAGPQKAITTTSPNRYFHANAGQITNSPVIGQSNFPTYNGLPGNDYLAAFRVQRYSRQQQTSWWAFWRR